MEGPHRIKYYGFIENGILHIMHRDRMSAEIKTMKNMDVTVMIKKQGRRSNAANRYYWGVLIHEIKYNLLDRGYRYNSDDIHEFLKQKFHYESIIIEATGERMDIGQTTTEMNVEEFAVYLDRIIEWCALSLELTIPPPNTQTVMTFEGGEKEN